MKIWNLTAVAAAVYLISLSSLLPASTVYDFIIKDPNHIRLTDIEGTIWKGAARSLHLRNHEISDIAWSINFEDLLFGIFSYDINASYSNRPLTGTFGLSFLGSLKIDYVKTSIDARLLGQQINIPIGQLRGDIDIDVKSAEFQRGSVPRVTAELVWKNASYIVVDSADLGTVLIAIEKHDTKPIISKIKNEGGAIHTSGQISVTEEGVLEVSLQLIPKSNASTSIKQSLKMIAKPSPSGGYELNYSGSLSQLGLM